MSYFFESHFKKSQIANRRYILRAVKAWESVISTGKARKFQMDKGVSLRKPPSQELKKAYERCIADLAKRYGSEMQRTGAEKRMIALFEKYTKREIKTSVWIGNRNVDIFIPSVRSKDTGRMNGLVVEINGPIHDSLAKMKKDEHLREYLAGLRVGLTVVSNDRVFEKCSTEIAQKISTMPYLDFRGRERLWRKIYIETVVIHSSMESLAMLFGPDVEKSRNLFFDGGI